MGLDTSHGAWSGAYSRFNRFRVAIGKAAGVKFPESFEDSFIEMPQDYQKTNPGLYEFFTHSDCDGEISPELCGKLANEMERILDRIADPEWRERAQQWIAGCRCAAQRGEDLEFG